MVVIIFRGAVTTTPQTHLEASAKRCACSATRVDNYELQEPPDANEWTNNGGGSRWLGLAMDYHDVDVEIPMSKYSKSDAN